MAVYHTVPNEGLSPLNMRLSDFECTFLLVAALLCDGVAVAWPHRNRNRDTIGSPPYQVNHRVSEPRLFGEGVVSTVNDEIGGAFSPDGTEFFFTQLVPNTTLPRLGLLCVSRYRDGKWDTPEALPFSGRYLDYPPRFEANGRRILFASSRPLPDGTRGGIRIWEVDRTATGWGDPRPLPAPINLPGSSWNGDPSVTTDGTLYFSSDRGGSGNLHIYRSRFMNGKYAEPEKLGPEVNSEFNDYQPFVSPDEKILLFTSVGAGEPPYQHRPEELTGGGRPYARGDLYVSYKREGKWTTARHLEHNINTVAEEEFPFLTPDGRYLFFSSERSEFTVPVAKRLDYNRLEQHLHSIYNGHGNIFFIDIEELGPPK
jgi:WD40-like Beta Propeller Repeat